MNIKEVLRYSPVSDYLRSIKLNRLKRVWRDRNCFNDTHAMNQFNFDNVSVGKCSYGNLMLLIFAIQVNLK